MEDTTAKEPLQIIGTFCKWFYLHAQWVSLIVASVTEWRHMLSDSIPVVIMRVKQK